MTFIRPAAFALWLAASTVAWADDDCHRPVAQWQPREVVEAHVVARGITVNRLRIDDGCYEVRGRDAQGHKVMLTLDPNTLDILSLRVRFRPGVSTTPYLPDRVPGADTPKPPPPTTGHPS